MSSCTRCTVSLTTPAAVAATCTYGTELNAAFRLGKVFATSSTRKRVTPGYADRQFVAAPRRERRSHRDNARVSPCLDVRTVGS